MKIIILANHSAIIPAIDHFHSQGLLQAVVSSDKLHSNNLQIEDICKTRKITFLKVSQPQLKTRLKDLFEALQPDLALMLGFSYRIPKEIFNIPLKGFYNIHFSLLPGYRGPDPVFWQLKNGESTGGISIHQVETDFDSGPIVMREQIPFIPGENWGICNSRYAPAVLNMLLQLINNLKANVELKAPEPTGLVSSYFPRPVAEDFIINWELQTAQQIEDLVNACNPLAGGAITFFRQQMVCILEVSPADHPGEASVPAGTIIHADMNGLFVQCMDRRILRLNILKLSEGIMSGFKLAAIGIKAGDQFENQFLYSQILT
jgi:methionyl-tRNA formyltransferase